MGLVDEVEDTGLQLVEGLLGDRFLVLLRLEITSRQQGDQSCSLPLRNSDVNATRSMSV